MTLIHNVPDQFETDRLVVRCPRPGDGEALYEAVAESIVELRRFPASMRWALQPPSVELSETYCRESHARFRSRVDLAFLAFRRDTGQLVCATGLHRPDWSVPKFEVGFWRRTSVGPHGFATETVGGLVEMVLSALGARRLEAFPDEENVRSCAVCERVGMTLEGTMRHERRSPDGSLRNTCVYALVR